MKAGYGFDDFRRQLFVQTFLPCIEILQTQNVRNILYPIHVCWISRVDVCPCGIFEMPYFYNSLTFFPPKNKDKQQSCVISWVYVKKTLDLEYCFRYTKGQERSGLNGNSIILIWPGPGSAI